MYRLSTGSAVPARIQRHEPARFLEAESSTRNQGLNLAALHLPGRFTFKRSVFCARQRPLLKRDPRPDYHSFPTIGLLGGKIVLGGHTLHIAGPSGSGHPLLHQSPTSLPGPLSFTHAERAACTHWTPGPDHPCLAGDGARCGYSEYGRLSHFPECRQAVRIQFPTCRSVSLPVTLPSTPEQSRARQGAAVSLRPGCVSLSCQTLGFYRRGWGHAGAASRAPGAQREDAAMREQGAAPNRSGAPVEADRVLA